MRIVISDVFGSESFDYGSEPQARAELARIIRTARRNGHEVHHTGRGSFSFVGWFNRWTFRLDTPESRIAMSLRKKSAAFRNKG